MVFIASKHYIDIYQGFSYSFDENGERELLQSCRECFKGKVVFFDVGANVGNWTAEAISAFTMYEGHLFEISNKTYNNLYNRFGNDSNLQLNNLALFNSNKEKKYKDYGENHGRNTLITSGARKKRGFTWGSVQAIKGDDYSLDHNITRVNLLKIDTDGSEYAVINGFQNLLLKKAIDIIQFEYGYAHGDAYTLMRDFFTFFEGYGYIVGPLRKEGVLFKSFSYSDNDFKSGPNYVASLPEYRTKISKF